MKQQLTNFLKIIRWKNILIYLSLQFLLYFGLFGKEFSFTNGWLFLVLSIVSFGIFGNIQNNILDYELDQKKSDFVDFSRTSYWVLDIIFLILGLIFGFTAFYLTFFPTILYAILSIPLLLSLYNVYVKKFPLAGNILIAGITSYAIYLPIAYTTNVYYQIPSFKFLLIMAFLLTFMRELIKDIEDVDFDRSMGYKTLPIISLNTSVAIFIILNLIYFYFVFKYRHVLNNYTFNTILITGVLYAFLSFLLMKQKRYKILTQIIKLMMIVGFITLIFLSDCTLY